jgi:CBS domain containing-hemolysin-like protein
MEETRDMRALEITLRLGIGVVLILANAFFVMTEFALTRLRQLPEEDFQKEGRLRRAWEMTEKLEIYLTSCQVGISLTSILLGILTEPAVTYLLRPVFDAVGLEGKTARIVSVVVAVAILNLIHKIWGEQAPTYLGVERPLDVARWTSGAHYWWTKVMYPVVFVGDGIAKWTLKLFGVEMERSWVGAEEGEEGSGGGGDDERREGVDERKKHERRSYPEIRREMGQLLAGGGVPADRREEVIRALEIDRIPVGDIMVPRDEMVTVSTEKPFEENLETLRRGDLSRFPLVGDSVDDPRGTLYLPAVFRHLDDLRSGAKTLDDIAVEVVTVPSDLPVSRLIDRLQQARQELALVEENDRVVGLVTLTEAFEVIAGESEDPYD